MNAPRRNEPCPCGSGRRYKDCHGKLDAGPPSLDALLQRGLAAHQQLRLDDAERDYRDVLAQDPANAVATHYLGLASWQRGDLADAESKMRASLALNGSVPDFHNNLGLLLRDTQRGEAAIEEFQATLRIDPGWIDAYSNLGLALESLARWDEAKATYRKAIELRPDHGPSRLNLGRMHLMHREFAEGWRELRWRHFASGDAAVPPDPKQPPYPPSLEGRKIALLGEQGIGDVLFFLRFAPELVERGASLAFHGDARLHPMLLRTGLFDLGASVDAPPAGVETTIVGDLPWLLDAGERIPPYLRLSPLADRVSRLREVLAAHGPPPYVALTWRAGTKREGPTKTQLKRIDPASLGAALRGRVASWISVQRLPKEGELDSLSSALGAPVLDLSAINDDLEDALALMSILDYYVGISNANVYFRVGTSPSMSVLLAHPPDWRWGIQPHSPWFPEVPIYLQRSDGDWSDALSALARDLPVGK